MKLDEDILERIVSSVKARLQSFQSRKRKARIHAVKFTTIYNDREREFIIKEVLHSQNKSIIYAIGNNKNIAIPSLGTFQYRETREAIQEIKREVKAKYGVTCRISECDPELAAKIREEIEAKKREVVIDLYYKSVGPRNSHVNHNFKNI